MTKEGPRSKAYAPRPLALDCIFKFKKNINIEKAYFA